MICKELENDLIPFLDRRLDPAGQARVEKHLAGCPECRKEADALRQTWHLLGYLPGRTASGKLPGRLLEAARLQLEVEKRWTHRLLRHAPLLASAALLFIVVGVTVLLPAHRATPDAEYDRLIAGLESDEDREIVENLDLYENLGTVENMDVLEEDQAVEYLDLVTSLSDEDF